MLKILQLCKKFPFPLKDGESIAVSYMARALADLDCQVTLLAMNTSKHWFDPALLPSDQNPYQNIHTVDVDNQIRPMAALTNLFTDQSYHIQRFIHPDFTAKLVELLQQDWFDVVQLETLYLAPYLPVIREHS
ncbi:MAG: glycosyl transferase family 1, partial [Bacteroidetes bacterium]